MGEEHLVACAECTQMRVVGGVNHVSNLNRVFLELKYTILLIPAHVVHFNHLATLGLRYRFADSKKDCMDNKEKWKSGNNRLGPQNEVENRERQRWLITFSQRLVTQGKER